MFKITNNGLPVINRNYRVSSIEKAFLKIKNGTITNEDINSSVWEKMPETSLGTFEKEGHNLNLSSIYSMGPGIKHDTQTTKNIINILLNHQGLELLELLNGTPASTTTLGYIVPSVWLHRPGNKGVFKTNKEGEAEGKISPGAAILLDSTNKPISLIEVVKNKTCTIDISQKGEGLKISYLQLNAANKTNGGQATINLDQTLDLRLSVAQKLTLHGGKLTLITWPNGVNPQTIDGLIIDSVSSSENQPINYYKSNNSYIITLPPSNSDWTLSIKVHLNSDAFEQSTGNFIPIIQNFTLIAQFLANDGVYSQASSPTINTSGINFVMTNTTGNRLIKGQSYYLGRQAGNKSEFYSTSGNWVQQKNDVSEYQTLSGGEQYTIGSQKSVTNTLAQASTAFSLSQINSINQSLIKIVGLGSGSYFLENKESHKKILFSVYRRNLVNSKGSLTIITSANNAIYQSPVINAQIPDFRAGYQEYNVLTSNGRLVNYELMRPLYIIFDLAVFSVIVILSGLLILRIGGTNGRN